MESSIAVFLWRRPACERLPTKQFHKANFACTALNYWTLCIVKRTVVIWNCDASPQPCSMVVCRLYSHRITSTVISAAYLRLFRHRLNPWRWIYQCIAWKASCHLELMSSKCIGWLNGLQTTHQKRTVVMHNADSSPLQVYCMSLFQPKTATIKFIAIALVKIYTIAV